MNLHQKMVIVFTDCLIIAEVFISMYLAYEHVERLTPLFLKYFFGMLIPTLIFAKIAVRMFRTRDVRVCP